MTASFENADRGGRLHGSLRRIRALALKETLQIIRDPSSLGIGIVLPVILILLFGFGLSLDVQNARIALVAEDAAPVAAELYAGFSLSPYFEVTMTPSMQQAQELMRERQVDAIVRVRPDFSRQLAGNRGDVQVLVQGSDANRARIIQAYADGAVGAFYARQAGRGQVSASPPVVLESRLWFNDPYESRYFLVPGLVVLVMTLIGALLTAMVMAREWERGTLEALFVTPVTREEILLGKTIPYFALGMIGLTFCILAAKFLFHVPLRGSLPILIGVSMLYTLVALSVGLLISAATKSQLVASQLTILVTFMPALMLSGFLFDLRSMPVGIRTLTYILPARYYVALLQTIFLAGNVWRVILPNAAVLAAMAAALLYLSRRATRKQLS